MPGSIFFSLSVWFKTVLRDPFRRYLFLILIAVGCFIYIAENWQGDQASGQGKSISFFFHPSCPHCQEQKKFNHLLKKKYPEIPWLEYDTSIPENAKKLMGFMQERGKSTARLGVPITFVGPYVVTGFDTVEKKGVVLESAVQAYLHDAPGLYKGIDDPDEGGKAIELPFWGEIKPSEFSLLSLAVLMGLIDGFNPCAMWVLVYLISLIMTLKDRRKIWLLVGTFVGASGILYFLFMTAWLNVFLLIGYLRILTLVIGLVAIGAGVLNVQEFIQTGGEMACKIGDASSKKKTMGKIDRIVTDPVSFFSVCSIIVLAFIVNSIEFACSAALPAIFTHTLSLQDLPSLHYYAYIMLYDFFFMLDDMIIFSLAVLALNTEVGHRYAKYCKLVGGGLLLGLGVMMVFFPDLLR